MERRWYSWYDPGTPRVFKPEKSLPDYFRDNVLATPNQIALSFYGYDMTYKELDEAIDRFAAGLVKLGVKKGDRVALYMANCPQFIISAFGTLRAGGIYVPMNSMFRQLELEYELNDCGAETVVALDYLFPEIKKIQDRIKLKKRRKKMWEKIMLILSGIGKFLFAFLKSGIARTVEEIGPLCLAAVRQSQMEGGTSQEKFDRALAALVAQLPGVAMNAIRIGIETAVAVAKEDADADGVPDIFDKCPEDANCQ